MFYQTNSKRKKAEVREIKEYSKIDRRRGREGYGTSKSI